MHSHDYCDRIHLLIIANQKEVTEMKEGIHPNYEKVSIRCACGEVIETASTKQNMRVDICSKCHPFFTGKQKLIDTGGRVDRFKKRFNIQSKETE